jgi:hypothetical protein
VESAAHAFSLFFRGTLANATELRLISVNARAVDAETAARLRTAVRNCTQLQGVELACSTGLTEDDVLQILESPSVRFVTVDGLPFADKRLRAGPNRLKVRRDVRRGRGFAAFPPSVCC